MAPATVMVWPEMWAASSEARKATVAATSSGYVTGGRLREIPAERQVDSRGLAMRMVVPEFG